MGRLAGILVSGVRALVIAAAILAPAVVVCEQGEVPEAQNLRRDPPVFLGYLVMFGLLTAVMLASLMPSKRGHQD